jgi:hypothetical protein
VGGEARYALTKDGDDYEWCGLRLTRARYFDSARAARLTAEGEQTGAGDGTD